MYRRLRARPLDGEPARQVPRQRTRETVAGAIRAHRLGGTLRRLEASRPARRDDLAVLDDLNTFKVESYFGRTVQFPLYTSLLVHKGYVVALTVPTWAPALAIGLDNRNAWRASRINGLRKALRRRQVL